MSSSKSVCAILALACLGVGSAVVHANPYASQISISGNTVTFNLNEAADSVMLDIGGTMTALPATPGFQSFTLPSSTTPFSIKVDKNSADGWVNGTALQVGTDSSLTVFNSPRGVAVNTNPGPYFGRIYVSNSGVASGITASGGATRASDGRGIYVLNADQSDALGQGDTPLTGDIPALSTGTSGNAPYRISVGPDNNLYIGDASSAYGGIYRTDPDVTSGSGTYMLYGFGADATSVDQNNHGEIYSKPIVKINGGNVSIYAIDAQLGAPNSTSNSTSTAQYNAIRRYDVGPVLPPGGFPSGPVPQTLIANPTTASTSTLNTFSGGLTTDLAQGPKDGRFYYMETRGNSNADMSNVQTGVYVVDPATGNILFDSLVQSRALSGNTSSPDLLADVQGVAVSPDNKYMALIVQASNTLNGTPVSSGNALEIVPLDATIDGVSGLPDLANMKVITNAFPDTIGFGRDINFDAAGNIYAVGSGEKLLRVFSPGGESSFTTSFDGTNFSFANSLAVHHPGDTNNDGVVDLTDLNNVLNNFGVTASGNAGDDNSDGVVDLTDLNNVLNNFGVTYAAGALSSVPEPASLSLLGLGAAAMLGRRRRRA